MKLFLSKENREENELKNTKEGSWRPSLLEIGGIKRIICLFKHHVWAESVEKVSRDWYEAWDIIEQDSKDVDRALFQRVKGLALADYKARKCWRCKRVEFFNSEF